MDSLHFLQSLISNQSPLNDYVFGNNHSKDRFERWVIVGGAMAGPSNPGLTCRPTELLSVELH